MYLVLLLFALFASLFTFSKSALEVCEPFFLIGSRMTVAGLILLVHQSFFNKEQFQTLSKKHIFALLGLGLVAIYITNIAEIWGLQYMSSAKACLIYSLSPFVAALFSFYLLKEHLTTKKWLGLLIGFIGIGPILLTQSSVGEIAKEMFIFNWSELALIIAVFASVWGWILLKRIVNEMRCSPIFANGIAMLVGGIMALAHSYFSGETWEPLPITAGKYKVFIEYAIWMLLISNVICYNLYGYLLRRFSATFMALAGLVTPLFASLFGWYFLNEMITWHFFASMGLFSLGLFLFYQEELAANNQVAILNA